MASIQRLWRDNWFTLLFVAALIGAYLFLRTPGDKLASTDEFDSRVSAGIPSLVEFYSNT